MARRLVEAGFVVSFALPVAFGSAKGPRAAAALLDGAFLVETDSPYLGPDAAGRNESTTALRVIAELGRLRGVDPQALVAPIRAAYDELIGPASL
jgi:TatD DNase family protein